MEREINIKRLSTYLNVSKEVVIKNIQELCDAKRITGFFEQKNENFIYFTQKEIEGVSSRLNKIRFSKSSLPQLISEMFRDINLNEAQSNELLNSLIGQDVLKGFITKDEFISLNYLLEFLLQIFWNEGKISILDIADELKYL